MRSPAYWKVVRAVDEYISRHNGGRPTIAELCEMTGIKSTSNVLYHLMAAVENGDLVQDGVAKSSRRYSVPPVETK